LYRGEFFIFTGGFVKRTPFGTRALLDKDIAEFSFSVTQEYTSYVTQDTIFRLALWPRGGTSLKPIRYRGYSKGGPVSPRKDALLNEVLARLEQAGAVDRKVREAKDWKEREHLPLSFRERCRVVGLALLYLISASDHHLTRPGSPAPAAGETLNPGRPKALLGAFHLLGRDWFRPFPGKVPMGEELQHQPPAIGAGRQPARKRAVINVRHE
jgi:hypothetical protein